VRLVVNAVKRLYELQQLDLEIQREEHAFEEIKGKLGENERLIQARTDLIAEEVHLEEANKQQKALEWELEDIRSKIAQVSERLYGGRVKNPKELVSFEQEAGLFKANLRHQEDTLLDIMADVEATQKKVKSSTERFRVLEDEWKKEQLSLSQQQTEIENRIADLKQRRQELIADIVSESLELYEGTKLRKGQAVVKVEQGRCQGCRVMLSTSELQRARAGNIVLCSTCNRILYLG
jgi:predicted  nucleic acid-binding Zn-ribbon protein